MTKDKQIKSDSVFYEIRQLLRDKWYFVLGVIPFILGFIGYYDEIHDFLDAAFKSIRLYVFEFDDELGAVNLFIQIARWTAPVVTVSGIAAILGNLVKHYKNRITYWWLSFTNYFKKLFKIGKPHITIAFFGDDNYESETLKNNLMKFDDTIKVKIIEMHKHVPRADLYILFGNDDENIEFYTSNCRKLEKFCRLNSLKEKTRLLSRDVVKSDFSKNMQNKIESKLNFRFDNKYILMKTETYSIKDEISDYINLVNLQELGAFKYWPHRWQGIYFNHHNYKEDLPKITSKLLEILYNNDMLHKDIDPSFIKDYVNYPAINSYCQNSFVDIDKDYVQYLCKVLNEENIKKLTKAFRFCKTRKKSIFENDKINKISSDICKIVFEKIHKTKCILPDRYKNLKISIIGDNDMAEYLLFCGFQLNIFYTDQKFTYNLFGNWNTFLNKREQLTKNCTDSIISYPSDWADNKQVINNSDIIIVCDNNKPLKIVEDLLLTTTNKKIDLISTKYDLYLKYRSHSHVNIYNYIDVNSNYKDLVEDNLDIDNVMNAFNYELIRTNGKIRWNEFLQAWNNQSSLYRYSYICQEEFLQMMENYLHCKNNKEKINKQYVTELDHIRWCRFMYYHNWKYGIPKTHHNNADIEHEIDPNIDKENKTHKMLVPYNELKKSDRAHIDVFISNCHKDKEKVNYVVKNLTQYNDLDYFISPFYGEMIYDEMLKGDKTFEYKIFKLIDTCDVFVCLWSKDTLNRCKDDYDLIHRQLEYCIKHDKKFINVVLDNEFTWPNDLPESVSKFKNSEVLKFKKDSSFTDNLASKINDLIN